jgi:formylglycine-generating enzyme required for sulfatase activity
VTWDEYGTYAFNKDIAEAEKQREADAIAKPSKPYGAIDRGFGYEGNPAIGMTFMAAQRYCEWLSRMTGKPYRLPTEAEWEYAARAGALERKPLPKETLDKLAWHLDNSDLKPHKVAQKQPNAWGLYDVLGNVMEWCVGLDGKADCLRRLVYGQARRGSPWRTRPPNARLEHDRPAVPQEPLVALGRAVCGHSRGVRCARAVNFRQQVWAHRENPDRAWDSPERACPYFPPNCL